MGFSARLSCIRWVLAAVLTVVTAPTVPAAPAPVTDRHPTLGFSINYPAGWKLRPADPRSGSLVGFAGPLAAGSKDIFLTITVGMTPLPLDYSIDDFFDDREALVQRAPRSGGYERLRINGVQIGGLPSLLWYFVQRIGDKAHLYNIHLLVVDGTRGYVIAGVTSASSPRLSEETQLLQASLLTFRLR